VACNSVCALRVKREQPPTHPLRVDNFFFKVGCRSTRRMRNSWANLKSWLHLEFVCILACTYHDRSRELHHPKNVRSHVSVSSLRAYTMSSTATFNWIRCRQ